MKITSKIQMFSLYNRGLFGNKIRVWSTAQEYLDDPNKDGVLVGIRLAKDSKIHMSNEVFINISDGPAKIKELLDRGYEEKSLMISEMAPQHLQTLIGEVQQSENYIDLTFSHEKLPMREALAKSCHYEKGARAVSILRYFMDASSYNDLQELLSTYLGAVVEFTCFSQDVGVIPHRNTVFWEVRNY